MRLAVLVACAGVLQVAESFVPHPLPGVRLGLANIVTLVALVRLGARSAVALAVLRTLVGALVMGTFLTPTFVLSLAGGVTSALVMAGCFRLSAAGRGLSYLGISIAGAVSHVAIQLVLVYLLFIRSPGVLWLGPWLVLAAVGAGTLTGLIAIQAMRRLGEPTAVAPLASSGSESRVLHEPPPDSLVRRLPAALKIAAVVALAVAVVISSWPEFYAAVFLFLVLLAAAARIRTGALALALLRTWPLVLTAFALPVLFTPWGRVLLTAGPVRVTGDGLRSGGTFAGRILLLFFATTVLSRTTPPAELAHGLSHLLLPLRLAGVRTDRSIRAAVLSWEYFPVFWEHARRDLLHNRDRRGWLDRFLHLPGDVVAGLYRLAEETAAAAGAGT